MSYSSNSTILSALAGLDAPLELSSYPSAGILKGKNRNVAWRVLDAKYFGVPQQRKRVYLVAGGKDFRPELVLFEKHLNQFEGNYSVPMFSAIKQ